MVENHSATFFDKSEKEKNIKEIALRYLRNWKWMLVSTCICVTFGFFYIKSIVPQYKSAGKVLIKEEKKNGIASSLDIFEDLGLSNGSSNLENEIEILKSMSLMKKVVSHLSLNVDIQLKENSNQLAFQSEPFTLLNSHKENLLFYEQGANFELTIKSASTFALTDQESGVLLTGKFGKAIKSKLGEIIIEKTAVFKDENIGKLYTVQVTPVQKIASNLQKSIQIGAASKESSVIIISLIGESIRRNNAIINSVIQVYEQSTSEDKNSITKSTSEFIDERMKVITQELSLVEVEGQEYKSAKSLTDLSTDAQFFLEANNEFEKKITEFSVQLEMTEYMSNYLSQQTDYAVLLPTNLGFQDASIASTIEQYNSRALERNRLLQSSSENNPIIKKIEGQLSGLKRSLVASLNNLRSNIKIQLKKFESEERLNQNKIASIPEYEREYRTIARQQSIKETLYLYLLQKREENEIAMAVIIGDIKLIDEPYSDGVPVSPQRRSIFLGCLFLGLLFPIGFIYIADLLDNKIRTLNDLQALNLPFLGDIPSNDLKDDIVAGATERSSVSEAFRMFRTNIGFLLHAETIGGKVIVITSSIKGEGKTFISLNLASSISLTNKKILMIEMDLRSPRLHKILKMPMQKGVSDYLVDKKLIHHELIAKSEKFDNLHFIFSGSIPPNPSELLHSKRLIHLLENVKSEYDFIIIDTAPVGLVVDTQLITPYADLTIYVARANYTDKRWMQLPVKLHNDKKIKNLALVLNDSNERSYNRYGYSYGKDEYKKSFLDKFRKH